LLHENNTIQINSNKFYPKSIKPKQQRKQEQAEAKISLTHRCGSEGETLDGHQSFTHDGKLLPPTLTIFIHGSGINASRTETPKARTSW